MTGVKKKTDGESAFQLIIDKLKITIIIIPLKNLLDSQLISYYLENTLRNGMKSYYELDKTGKIVFLREKMIKKFMN